MMKSGPLFSTCLVCHHHIPEGDSFCDSLCQDEYEEKICVMCNEFNEDGHTITHAEVHPDWEGKRICKECWEKI